MTTLFCKNCGHAHDGKTECALPMFGGKERCGCNQFQADEDVFSRIRKDGTEREWEMLRRATQSARDWAQGKV